MDKPWDNSNKSSRLGNSSQHTTIWGSTTSTPGLTTSSSGCLTNDQSSSLVSNEDSSAVTSVRSDTVLIFMEDGWGRTYSDGQKNYYLHRKDEDSIWEIDLDKANVIEKKCSAIL